MIRKNSALSYLVQIKNYQTSQGGFWTSLSYSPKPNHPRKTPKQKDCRNQRPQSIMTLRRTPPSNLPKKTHPPSKYDRKLVQISLLVRLRNCLSNSKPIRFSEKEFETRNIRKSEKWCIPVILLFKITLQAPPLVPQEKYFPAPINPS